jgi:lipopolysaccharide/colanic/teichoic acid biosynthesis glycosyltransferase
MRVEDPPGLPITVTGDPRITALGAFLRRYKLDELPQFWNVLIGDMSLVGPRPKLPHHEGLNLSYRPGITGMATLAFRDEENLLSVIPQYQLDSVYDKYIKPTKARLDSEYMKSATFWSDLTVLWSTAFSCSFGLENLPDEQHEYVTRFAAWSAPRDLSDPRPQYLNPDRERWVAVVATDKVIEASALSCHR